MTLFQNLILMFSHQLAVCHDSGNSGFLLYLGQKCVHVNCIKGVLIVENFGLQKTSIESQGFHSHACETCFEWCNFNGMTKEQLQDNRFEGINVL